MSSFDSLKREAVQLERQLEEKVHRFQQLAQRNPVDAVSSVAEQGGFTAARTDFDHISRRLQTLVVQMSTAATTASHRAVASRMETIRSDLQRDFHTSIASLQRAAERQELLSSASPISGGSNGGGEGMDALLRERGHISNSLNVASNTLSQVETIRDDLHYQGRSLRNTGSVMASLTSTIPGMNRLVEAIRTRRSRDDQIVAVVMASCIFFTLWYIFG